MAKQCIQDILYNESFKNKKCDKIEIKLGIKKCLYFTSMNSQIIIFLESLEKIKYQVHLRGIQLKFIPG